MHKSVWKAANLTDGRGCLWGKRDLEESKEWGFLFLKLICLIFFSVSVFFQDC